MSDADDRDEELEEEEREEGEERNDDAREAAAAAAPEEELQDEKPFTGEVELALKAGAHDRIIVRFPAADEEGVPQWLHYLVNDDAYWFARCVEGKVRLQSNGAGAGAGGDEEEGEGAPAAAAAPATAGGGEDADGEDTNKTFVDPNKLFILTQTDGSDIFVCQRYVPPPPATEEEGQGVTRVARPLRKRIPPREGRTPMERAQRRRPKRPRRTRMLRTHRMWPTARWRPKRSRSSSTA
jgi:hypothetical protein